MSCPLHLRLSIHLLLVVHIYSEPAMPEGIYFLYPGPRPYCMLKGVVQPAVNRMNASILYSMQFNTCSRYSIHAVCTCSTDVVQAVPITTGSASVGALLHVMHCRLQWVHVREPHCQWTPPQATTASLPLKGPAL